jgi:hypothetical protein
MSRKRLSNSFSTGSGGSLFEAHIQAAFVTLLITGGYTPCFPSWPIIAVKLQGKIDGYATDDLIVTAENSANRTMRKMLGQVKHSIGFTKGNMLLGEVLRAAWDDYNNPAVFTQEQDAIALITGPLSGVDQNNVPWLLEHARATTSTEEFYRHVTQANFSPTECEKKLDAIRHHLDAANGGRPLSDESLVKFLRHFHLLGYDLNIENSVTKSLLHSHISQYRKELPTVAWLRIVEFVQKMNTHAATITKSNLPEDLLELFKEKVSIEFPKELAVKAMTQSITDWAVHADASLIVIALLIGAWDENRDTQEISNLLGVSYESWLLKAKEILQIPDSPLSVKDGAWKVARRAELLPLLGSRILDQNLDAFRVTAVKVLKERDPAFELPAGERYAASIYGKVSAYSPSLRKGLTEGLALVSNNTGAFPNASQGKAEAVGVLAVREILSNADWVIWGSLNNLLPILAEAAPGEFLGSVEAALRLKPCPFDELFAQEGSGTTGGNHLTGLFWALEGLAWEPELLVRVCVLFAELASHDPGGNWMNRPSNSLSTILLPWLPQTLGSIEKRKVAVQTVLAEQPEIGWNLLLELLPSHHQVSNGSHKPKWRKSIPGEFEKGVSHREYFDQISSYSELAIQAADTDPAKLAQIISRLGDLVRPSFDELLIRLKSEDIIKLPEGPRREVWDALVRFVGRHRKFSDAQWALPGDAVEKIEAVVEVLAPKNPFNLHQYLFNEGDFDLYEGNGNWQELHKKLDVKREAAIQQILEIGGISEVIRFTESIRSAQQVGLALGSIANDSIDQNFLPEFLDHPPGKLKDLANAYVWRRYSIMGWDWCDSIVTSDWSLNQKAEFLCQLPFSTDTWNRATNWLGAEEGRYWSAAPANPYQSDDNLSVAIAKLIEFNRPYPAIGCLHKIIHDKQTIIIEQVVQALLLTVSSTDHANSMDTHHIVELIKFLQSEPSVSQDDLFKVEWAYLTLLNSIGWGAPKFLERKLATEPEFFCEIIRLIYRSKKEDESPVKPSENEKAVATNAWRLLHDWSTPPGTQADGSFFEQHFMQWLETAKTICRDSGHLEVALVHVGEVLIKVPADTNGLWINSAVASALNGRDHEYLRRGFSTAVYNSRGAHWVDPTGNPEKKLAEEYRHKAEGVENAGFQRFATTLREVATDYEHDAERVIASHRNHVIDED